MSCDLSEKINYLELLCPTVAVVYEKDEDDLLYSGDRDPLMNDEFLILVLSENTMSLF